MRGVVFDVVESPLHPDLGPLCAELGLERRVFSQQRKAMAAMKQQPPDYVVADFYFGYGNNYAGANISNLDVLLRSAQRFAPNARIVVLAEPTERPHLDKLAALFALHAKLDLPADGERLRTALSTD
ncbi:MAG: hypothetical protein KDI88_14495 [Gammaproteobacteria bacterium]|nr:hypothetical protein [Gammaproteobacteria bacterium]MCB1774822.1 hypothetical protein [Gammaproteobacteria bacterium]